MQRRWLVKLTLGVACFILGAAGIAHMRLAAASDEQAVLLDANGVITAALVIAIVIPLGITFVAPHLVRWLGIPMVGGSSIVVYTAMILLATTLPTLSLVIAYSVVGVCSALMASAVGELRSRT
jgi:hypothetical protein